MKPLFFLFSGLLIGLWAAWPGIVNLNNWKCFRDIINKSTNEQMSLKFSVAFSLNYFLKCEIKKIWHRRVVNYPYF